VGYRLLEHVPLWLSILLRNRYEFIPKFGINFRGNFLGPIDSHG